MPFNHIFFMYSQLVNTFFSMQSPNYTNLLIYNSTGIWNPKLIRIYFKHGY